MTSRDLELLNKMMAGGGIGRREFLGAGLAAGAGLSVASGLWSRANAATPERGGHFVQAIAGASTTSSMDPTTYTNTYDSALGYTWGQRLLGNDPVTGDYTLELATGIDTTDGGITWVVKLRNDVSFHNGKSMTSADVVYSLNRHRGEDSKSGAAGTLTSILDVKATGPDEITITLDAINADLPFLITDYHLLIQPEGSTDDGVGTGGYIVREYRPGEVAMLERNPDYWGDGCWFDSVESLSINDATARTTALVTGKAHLIDRVDPKTTDLLRNNSNVEIESTTGRAHYVLIMHCNTAPFDNNDMRLALKYAIDRQELVDKILRGYGALGNDYPINEAYPLFPTDIEQRTYDPDKARFHYKKSGHEGKVLLQVSNAAFSGAEDAAVLYQQHAMRAGIELEVKREPADGYWDNVWNVQPFCVSYWSGRPTQDQMYSVAYKTDAPWNDTRFFNEAFDQLLLSARSELDSVKRKAIYSEMAVVLRDEGGLICPMFNDFIDARAKNLAGYVQDPLGAVSNGLAPTRCWFSS